MSGAQSRLLHCFGSELLVLASMSILESPCPIGSSNSLSRWASWASFGLDSGPFFSRPFVQFVGHCVECLALARTADLDAFLMNSASFCMHSFLCLHVSYCLGTCCKIVCFRSVFLCCRHTALVLFRLRLDPFACFDTCILESLRCAVRAFLCSCCCVCFSTDACLGRLPYSLFFLGAWLLCGIFLHVFCVQLATIVLMHGEGPSFVHSTFSEAQ